MSTITPFEVQNYTLCINFHYCIYREKQLNNKHNFVTALQLSNHQERNPFNVSALGLEMGYKIISIAVYDANNIHPCQ